MTTTPHSDQAFIHIDQGIRVISTAEGGEAIWQATPRSWLQRMKDRYGRRPRSSSRGVAPVSANPRPAPSSIAPPVAPLTSAILQDANSPLDFREKLTNLVESEMNKFLAGPTPSVDEWHTRILDPAIRGAIAEECARIDKRMHEVGSDLSNALFAAREQVRRCTSTSEVREGEMREALEKAFKALNGGTATGAPSNLAAEAELSRVHDEIESLRARIGTILGRHRLRSESDLQSRLERSKSEQQHLDKRLADAQAALNRAERTTAGAYARFSGRPSSQQTSAAETITTGHAS